MALASASSDRNESFTGPTKLRETVVIYAALANIYLLFFLLLSLGRGTLKEGAPIWASYFDQSLYWRSAQALARGDLGLSEHWYPLAYPLLLAPLSGIGRGWDTLLVDLILYLLTLAGFLRVAARFGISQTVGAALFAVSTMLPLQFANSWILPWTTTLSAAAIWAALALVLEISDRHSKESAWRYIVFGAFLGVIPCSRPGDIVVAIPIGLAAAGLIARKRDWRGMALMVAGGSAVMIPYALLWLAIWGPRASPYMELGSGIGFNFHWLGWKAYLILIEPRPWFPQGTAQMGGIIRFAPWLPLGAAGAVMALLLPGRRLASLVLLVPSLAYLILTLAYVDLLPSGLWRHKNIHYFKWVFPLFALLAFRFVITFRTAPIWHGTALATVLAISCLRYTPIPAGPDYPARLIVYRANNSEFIAYFADTVLTDRGGGMRNFYEYHPVPDEDGKIYAVALQRDFLGDERVSISLGQSSALSISGKAGTTEAKEAALASFGALQGRYRPRVSLGVPCWLPGYDCPGLPPLGGHRP